MICISPRVVLGDEYGALIFSHTSTFMRSSMIDITADISAIFVCICNGCTIPAEALVSQIFIPDDTFHFTSVFCGTIILIHADILEASNISCNIDFLYHFNHLILLGIPSP